MYHSENCFFVILQHQFVAFLPYDLWIQLVSLLCAQYRYTSFLGYFSVNVQFTHFFSHKIVNHVAVNISTCLFGHGCMCSSRTNTTSRTAELETMHIFNRYLKIALQSTLTIGPFPTCISEYNFPQILTNLDSVKLFAIMSVKSCTTVVFICIPELETFIYVCTYLLVFFIHFPIGLIYGSVYLNETALNFQYQSALCIKVVNIFTCI